LRTLKHGLGLLIRVSVSITEGKSCGYWVGIAAGCSLRRCKQCLRQRVGAPSDKSVRSFNGGLEAEPPARFRGREKGKAYL